MLKYPEEKINAVYLEQIGNNEEEKFGDLEQIVKQDRLPKVNDKINLLDLGVGGGETMLKLKNRLSEIGSINIVGLDMAHMFADKFKKTTQSEAVVADAGLIPIKKESISAVNASALLHEVSSYGVTTENREKIFGPSAVKKSLDEIKRCLVDEGMLIYRDVACPKDRLKIKTVDYKRRSWQMFLDMYLPAMNSALKNVSPDVLQGYKLKKEDANTSLEATAQIHREIQRHYITFRDYFRKKLFPEMGVEIIEENWLEKEKGNKEHSLKLSGIALECYKRKHPNEGEAEDEKLTLTMTSDEYDDLTDEIIESGLEKEISDFYEEWFKREGHEIYTYLETDEIKQMASELDQDQKALVVEKEEMIPRYYYQRYLNRVIENPEFEGKQTINFIKKSYGKQTRN